MTEEERKQKAAKLWEDVQEMLEYLYARWQDESQYEDINDYGINLKKEVEKIGGTFLKMYKRPFGFSYVLADATYRISVGATSYKYNRIA